jgi:hypothetical protein
MVASSLSLDAIVGGAKRRRTPGLALEFGTCPCLQDGGGERGSQAPARATMFIGPRLGAAAGCRLE